MHPLVSLITRDYNPKGCNFIRVDASNLLSEIQQSMEKLDEEWDTIFEELRINNIFMQPALPDVKPDEFVRIFRADSPLGRVILEAITPTANGDKLMAQAISKLNMRCETALRHSPNGQARQKKQGRSRRFQKLPQKRHNNLHSSFDPGSREAPDPTHVNKSSHYIRPLE